MAVYSGPKVVTDGMVLHLDKYNEESYLGEPATNVFIDGGLLQADGGYSGTKTYTKPPGLNIDNLDDYWIAANATQTWWGETYRFIFYPNPSSALAASTSYRGSFYARKISGTGTSLRFGWYGNSTNNSQTITDQWQRFEFSATTNATYRGLEMGSVSGNIVFQLAGVQAETNTNHTKYVGSGGTRSATDGWRDLSGNGLNANLTSLTYNATNVPNTNVNDFSFDNSVPDKVTGPSNWSSIMNPGGLTTTGRSGTLSAWVKYDTITTGSTVYTNGCIAGKGNIYFSLCNNSSAKPVAYYYNSAGAGYQTLAGTTVMTTGNWYNIVYVWAASNSKLYTNGAKEYDQNNVGIGHDWSSGGYNAQFQIGDTGSYNTNKLDGQIGSIMTYDRALSAVEVLQNFNASKGRYGL